mmetsp:Transcript_32235/g.67181  ORF Transcript_32235/g.67181 Transcript_32235/m.67181 type:complete len:416 (-) Transcript_32235:1498-2745(-)
MSQEKGKMNQGNEVSTTNQPKVVKELGRRARARLEEERTKRAEIVRLDQDDLSRRQQQHLQPQQKGNKNKRTNVGFLPPKPQKRPRQRRASAGTTTKAVIDESLDSWIPDLTNVVECTGSKETRSTMVLLHGLPRGTTPSQIRRFFSGLDPQQILVLLSCSSEIDAWDSPGRPRRNKKQQQASSTMIVQRHPSTFRVVVKFDSSPAAELAAERSGEPLEVTTRKTGDASPDTVRASIGVTHMVKAHANLILQKLSVNVLSSHNKTTPLEESLAEIEQQVPANVHRILWMEANRKLELDLEPCASWALSDAASPNGSILDGSSMERILSLKGYETLTQQHNTLVRIIDELRLGFPYPSAEILDPIYAEDPIVRLSHEALGVLQNMVRATQQRLLVHRRERLFSEHPIQLRLNNATD